MKKGLTRADLKVGTTYRGKRPATRFSWTDGHHFNDRTIIHIGLCEVQYDGPAVANGRQFPKVSFDAFLKWASHEVKEDN